jgi:hypothetical protein
VKKPVVFTLVVVGLALLSEPQARAGVSFSFGFPISVPSIEGPVYYDLYYLPQCPYYGGYYGPYWPKPYDYERGYDGNGLFRYRYYGRGYYGNRRH